MTGTAAARPPLTNRAECWGCGAKAPANQPGAARRHGWHTRRTTAVAEATRGLKPRRYVLTEFACPACFAATGGWYPLPTEAK